LLNIKYFFIFYLFIYCISTIVIILTTRYLIAITTQSFFISQETTSFLLPKSMLSPSINSTKYASKFALFENLNNYIKQYNYSIVIRSINKNNKNIKSKIYVICNCKRKSKSNYKQKAIKKQIAIFKRINCSF